MKRVLTIGGAFVGAVLLFYLIAPTPGAGEDFRVDMFDRDPAVARARAEFWATGDTVRALDVAHQRTAAWEEARALPRTAARTGVIVRPGLDERTARNFEQAAQAELASFGATTVPLRIVLKRGEGLSGAYRKLVVLPQDSTQPCVVVVLIPERARNLRANGADRMISACGFYGRFGYPGAGMEQWLADTRGIAAARDTFVRIAERAREREALRGSNIGFEPAAASCLAGRDDDCASAILDPRQFWNPSRIVPPTDRTRLVLATYANWGNWGPGPTLARLRDFVGDARFQQIWSSSATPAEAFQQATGEHVAVFARPILLEESLPHHPGPLRGGLPLLFTLGIGASAALWAIRRTRRERS